MFDTVKYNLTRWNLVPISIRRMVLENTNNIECIPYKLKLIWNLKIPYLLPFMWVFTVSIWFASCVEKPLNDFLSVIMYIECLRLAYIKPLFLQVSVSVSVYFFIFHSFNFSFSCVFFTCLIIIIISFKCAWELLTYYYWVSTLNNLIKNTLINYFHFLSSFTLHTSVCFLCLWLGNILVF